MLYLILIVAASTLLVLWLLLRRRQLIERDQALRRLLDGADDLESGLLACRARMQQLRAMLVALPEEMIATASVALTADNKVQAGLRDLLAHRLWIKQHAQEATPGELQRALSAIEQSRQVLNAQLNRLDAITGELAQAQSSASSVTPREKPAA